MDDNWLTDFYYWLRRKLGIDKVYFGIDYSNGKEIITKCTLQKSRGVYRIVNIEQGGLK